MLGKKKPRLSEAELGYVAGLTNVENMLRQLQAGFAQTIQQKHGIKGGFTIGPDGEIIQAQTRPKPE